MKIYLVMLSQRNIRTNKFLGKEIISAFEAEDDAKNEMKRITEDVTKFLGGIVKSCEDESVVIETERIKYSYWVKTLNVVEKGSD